MESQVESPTEKAPWGLLGTTHPHCGAVQLVVGTRAWAVGVLLWHRA